MSGRVVAFDLGDRRIGVAVSDEMGVLATGRDTIRRDGESYPWRALLAVVAEAEAVRIVVGDPLHLDGEAGERSRLAHEFAREIGERTGLPVELEDERLTSEEAEAILDRRGRGARTRRREDVDRVAATLILQEYLDHRAGGAGKGKRT
jgi:putative pre-16S rRNA nuclease